MSFWQFIVEDGSALPNSNSYASLEEIDSYFALRMNKDWAHILDDDPNDPKFIANPNHPVFTADDKKIAFLVMATAYIELRFGPNFIGFRATDMQALSWPRYNTLKGFDCVIPKEIKYATFEYALRAINGPLAPDLAKDSAGAGRFISHEQVGPLITKYQMDKDKTSVQLFPDYPLADNWLMPLLHSTNRCYR